MPLLDSQPDENDSPQARFPEEAQQTQGPSPSWLDVAASAERSDNLVGQLYSRITNDTLIPKGDAEPAFNPVDHVPTGYLHDYGSRFLSAQNPQQVQQVKTQIDSERADQQILARAGGRGLAASLAAGATDPLTLASMALVPEAAPTRLGNALRWGLTNAATTAGQEALSSSLSETRTPGQSMLNIGASAVLGGLLGSIAKRVPAGELGRLQSNLATELKPGGEEGVLGPNQRSVLEPTVDVERLQAARGVTNEANAALAAHENSLRDVVEGPEGQTVALRTASGANEDISRQVRIGRETLNEASAVLAKDKGQRIAEESERIENQLRGPSDENVYIPERSLAQMKEESTQRATAIVEAERSSAESRVQTARELLSKSEPEEAMIWKVRGAEADLEQFRETVRNAKTMDEALQALPKEKADQLRRALESNGTPAHTLDLEGRPLPQEGATDTAHLPAAEHALPGEPAYVNPENESTTGAAAVAQPTAEGLSTARGAKTYSKVTGFVSPGARIMQQPSVKARQLLTDLANVSGTLEQNYRGVASSDPIERKLWGYEGLNVEGMQARRAAYGEYTSRMQKEGAQPLSRRDFMDSISSAMRRGDKSPVPEVAKAATWTRQNIFDPLFQRAVKLGLTPEEATLHADSYLTRQYDAVKIRNNFGGWIDTLRTGFIKQGVDPAEATDLAQAASRNVMGSERGTMDWHALDDVVPKSGKLKERTLSLPDSELEPFLNNDIDHLSHSYLRSMAPEVEMTERFGSRDLKDQFADITDEYAHLIEKARSAGDNAQMNALDKQRNNTISDLSAIRDRLYGTFGAPKDPGSFAVRAGRLLRSVNALRLLGGATISHFPDLANVIARYGMGNTFGAMAKLATSMQASKLALRQAQRMGAAIDMTMNISASLLGDYGSHSQYLEQRVAGKLARGFTIATGETPLITLTQAMTSTLAQDEILRTAAKVAAGKALNPNLAAKLAAAGLDQDMLGRIATEGANHTHEVNGLKFGMSDQWMDKKAAQAFESAVLREAHGVTLRPGVADTPLFMSKEWGKSLAQFKSFAFAANRVVGVPLLQGLAHGDARAVEAMVALASMGTLAYITKQKAAGQPLETNPTRLALEVLDKSNLLGWTGEVIYPGLWAAGFKDLSRFSDRDPVETFLGPSAGMAASTWGRQFPGRLANLASGGTVQPKLPFRRSDLHFLRRMAPGQNLWYFRRAVNNTEDGIGDLFGLPGESNADREIASAVQ